ncbi:MAG: epoxyqueuosine reductase QueH [Candidatus Omnitrophota bacterium]
MANLLLHICCGPCAIYPVSLLREMGYKITGFFYNPNIYPEEEFLKRKEALYILSERENFEVVYTNYSGEDFFSNFFPNQESVLSQAQRCPKCWEMRLLKTADYAINNGFDLFSTTLLVSPFQDQNKIKMLGEEIAQRYGTIFLYRDFRTGFREAQNKAKELKLYRQNYCGCLYSKMERERKVARNSPK